MEINPAGSWINFLETRLSFLWSPSYSYSHLPCFDSMLPLFDFPSPLRLTGVSNLSSPSPLLFLLRSKGPFCPFSFLLSATIQKHLQFFQRGWNCHRLLTEANQSPLQLWTRHEHEAQLPDPIQEILFLLYMEQCQHSHNLI